MRNRIGRIATSLTVAAAIAGAAGLLVARTAAATATATIAVSATVSAMCTISANPLAFGPYDPVVANASTNLDQAGSLSVACTKGTSAPISLNLGTHASGTTRRMQNGTTATEFLTYEIYTTAGRTVVWNTANTVTYTAASKAAATVNVYGRVPSNQDVAIGNYTDSVTATITFQSPRAPQERRMWRRWEGPAVGRTAQRD